MDNRNKIILLAILVFGKIYAQIGKDGRFESRLIEVKGIQTHYLDFGGEGLPIILVHSEGWDANNFQNFGPLFTADNRVIAVTRPGYGESGMGNYSVESQGDHLIAFAKALGFDKTVYMGNASASKELTYLAENHAGRLAGIVYLSGPATPWLDVSNEDPYKAFEMFGRASPSANEKNNDRKKITLTRKDYTPKHYSSDSIAIEVPALMFLARNGRQGHEKGVAALVFSGSPLMDSLRKTFPESPLKAHLDRVANDSQYREKQFAKIKDPEARAYFYKLSSDVGLQKKVYGFHMTKVYPATLEAQDKLMDAYGDHLKLVRLDVPQIVGYEYSDNPELITDHIRAFLKHLVHE